MTGPAGPDRPEGMPGMTSMRWGFVFTLASLYRRELPHDLPVETIGAQMVVLGMRFASEHPEEADALMAHALAHHDDAERAELENAVEMLTNGTASDMGFNVRALEAWAAIMPIFNEWAQRHT